MCCVFYLQQSLEGERNTEVQQIPKFLQFLIANNCSAQAFTVTEKKKSLKKEYFNISIYKRNQKGVNWFNRIFDIFKAPQNILQLPEISRIPREIPEIPISAAVPRNWGHRESLQHKVIIWAPEKSAKIELKKQKKKIKKATFRRSKGI